MSKQSNSFKYNLDKPCPVFFIPEILPFEDFRMITDQAAPGVLPYYAISNYGRIWHVYENKFMSTTKDNNGHRIAILRMQDGTSKTFRVHRLLMLTFKYEEYIEMTQKYPEFDIVATHIGNKSRNYVDFPGVPDNIVWKTQQFIPEEVDKVVYKEARGNAAITTDTAHRICQMIKDKNLNHTQIAQLCNTTVAMVENIKYKRSWKHVSCLYF